MLDLTTESDVIKLLESSQSEQEWNKNCNEIKAANDGHYPGFWFQEVVVNGLMAHVSSRWGGDDKIHISVIDDQDW